MSDLPVLNGAQMQRIKPFFPRSHGIPRVDDRRVLIGIFWTSAQARRGVICLKSMGRVHQHAACIAGEQ